MLLHGDSTVHGLLQEGLEMWSDIKPFKNPRNKSVLANIGCANVDAYDGVPKLDVVWGSFVSSENNGFHNGCDPENLSLFGKLANFF